jgi:hypothetical protein
MRTLDCNGLLFIGDPHLSSRGPHRRKDDYTAAVLDKLRQTVRIANTRGLLWVCLGDLFDRPRDTDPAMFTALLGILGELDQQGVVLAGNHEKVASVLTDDTALGLLAATRFVDVVATSRAVARVRTPQGDLVLHGIPHGERIPTSLPREAPRMVCVTHHDLAIGGATYPGAVAPWAIEGVDMVVNGHDHTTKPWEQVGPTLYCNTGNISRVSLVQQDHVPQVFALEGQGLDLQPIALQYTVDVFDLTGHNAPKAGAADLVQSVEKASEFVRMLRDEETAASVKASADGAEVRDEIKAVLAERARVPAGLPELLTLAVDLASEQ